MSEKHPQEKSTPVRKEVIPRNNTNAFSNSNLERAEDGLVPSATAVKTELRCGDQPVLL
jgi:hypothetical protein